MERPHKCHPPREQRDVLSEVNSSLPYIDRSLSNTLHSKGCDFPIRLLFAILSLCYRVRLYEYFRSFVKLSHHR